MKMKGRNNPAVNVLLGIGAAVMLVLLLISIASKMIISQKIGEGSAEVLVTLILLVASLTGTGISALLQSNNILKTSILTTCGILLAVVIGALVVDGPFQGVALRTGAILGGGLISCVICMKKGGKTVKRKRRYR